MNKAIARHCNHCKEYGTIEAHQGHLSCPNCGNSWGKVDDINRVFDYCPICQCRQFYLSKDFNQFMGCGIMLCGIVLVPFTYGLSLPVFALVDWFLHKRVPTIISCYKCGCEFRGFKAPKHLKSFIHQIGLKYDKFR